MSTAKSDVPQHVAIIMDGNGRWAKSRGLPRIRGHQVGADSVKAVLKACRTAGVKYLTLYAFSTENWIRPKAEVMGLMSLLSRFLRDQSFELHENKTRLLVIGRTEDLPAGVRKELFKVIAETSHYTEGTLTLALSYGSRLEITDAVKAIAEKVKRGELKPSAITDKTISEHLYTAGTPDPDFLIRTSGEQRISNFLLWQISYAEFFFTPVPWPEFREPQFLEALEVYKSRHRRFGDIK